MPLVDVPEGYTILKNELVNDYIRSTVIPDVKLKDMEIRKANPVNKNWIDVLINSKGNDYEDLINGIVKDHLDIAKKTVEEFYNDITARQDFMELMREDLDNALTSGQEGVDAITGEIYIAGANHGYSKVDVDKFFSPADFQALSAIRDYNFGLIKNVSSDMRTAIQKVIFEGKANGSDMRTVANNIRDLGINPIQAGGRMLTTSQRSMLIARTETARASMQGNLTSLQQLGVESYTWADTGDERECDECASNAQNSPYTIDNLPEYPAHPDDRCDIAPESINQDVSPEDPNAIMNLVNGNIYSVSDKSIIAGAGDNWEDLSQSKLEDKLLYPDNYE